MSDETVQQLEAVIRRDGKGEVRVHDAVTPIDATDSDELRALVMQHVIGTAAELGGPVRLRCVDVDGVYHLVVHPGGEILEEGAFEPLQLGDDDLWSEATAEGSGGTPGPRAADGDVDDGELDDGEPHDGELDEDDELDEDELDDDELDDGELDEDELDDDELDDGELDDGELDDDELDEDELDDDELDDDELDDGELDEDELDDDELDDGELDDGELDDDELDDDDGGFHDEALDDEFDDGTDADDDEPSDGARETTAASGDPELHDGGYAALFGEPGAAADHDDGQANVHATIQLPRPGMMRDEPPAVTAMHPIIPPGGVPSLPGSGAGSEIAAESIEDHDHDHGEPHGHEHEHEHEHADAHDHDHGEPHGHEHANAHDHDHQYDADHHGDESHVHEWGDNRFTAMRRQAQDAQGGEFETADKVLDSLDSDTAAFDGLESDPPFDDESGDDNVVADWGTGGLDVVTGATAVGSDGADDAWQAPVGAADAAPGSEPGAAWLAPATDQSGWTPNFPRGRRAGAPEPETAQRPDFEWGASSSDEPGAPSTASGESAASDTGNSPDHPASPRSAREHGGEVPSEGGRPGASDRPGAQAQPGQPGQPEDVRATGAGPTLGDFLADRTSRGELPASRGWRAGLRRTTGGLVSFGPSVKERAERDDLAAIQRQFDGPKTIVVVNPKGGAHKTTTTLMVAASFGVHRGGYTLAWDNNETRGTLGWRSHRAAHNRTAVDLLRQLSHFEISGGATIADVDRFVRNQGEAKFDVLASDDDAASAAIIDAEAFWRLHRTLSRFYRVLVIDTGNNMRASNWEAALDIADQLVIVSTAREDTAASAAWLADGLRERGHGDKLANAVTVLSSPSPKEDPQLTARLRDHFAQLTRAVVDVPYDEEFVGGGELDIGRLRAETRDAWRHAAAVIAQGL